MSHGRGGNRRDKSPPQFMEGRSKRTGVISPKGFHVLREDFSPHGGRGCGGAVHVTWAGWVR